MWGDQRPEVQAWRGTFPPGGPGLEQCWTQGLAVGQAASKQSPRSGPEARGGPGGTRGAAGASEAVVQEEHGPGNLGGPGDSALDGCSGCLGSVCQVLSLSL